MNKYHLAELFASIEHTSEEFSSTKPIFITSFGFIEGTIVLTSEKETDPSIKTYFKFCANHKKQNETESQILFLKNVRITTATNLTYKLKFIALYPEQIIGISLSNPTIPLLDLEDFQHTLLK